MPLTNTRILAIDDTPSIRTFLRISLEAQGATFYEAANALEGVQLCHQIRPELIVLDLGLPDKDGMEILSELKQSEHAPAVVILSVRKEQHSKERAATLGADAYLTKPFLMEELIEVIERILNVKLHASH